MRATVNSLTPKVIALKFYLAMARCSPEDVTRVLRGCFRGGDVEDALKMVDRASSKRKSPTAIKAEKKSPDSF